MKTLFVVTHGRTGSSMLQAVLNSVPGVQIAGEDGGLWRDIFLAEQKLVDRRDRVSLAPYENLSPGNPFYCLDFVTDAALHAHWRALAADLWDPAARLYAAEMAYADRAAALWTVTGRRLADASAVIGQKELRWAAGQPTWLQKVWGRDNVAFLFLLRDIFDVAESGWWRWSHDARKQILQEREHVLSLLAEVEANGPSGNCALLDYNRLENPDGSGPDWKAVSAVLHWLVGDAGLEDKDGVDPGLLLDRRHISAVLRNRSSF